MSQPPSPTDQLDAIYLALGHRARRGMIATLSFRPATVSQLAAEHGVSLPAIHKHLRALEAAELIQRKKVGRTNFVAINRVGIRLAQAWLLEFRADWGSNRETLDNYIAGFTDS